MARFAFVVMARVFWFIWMLAIVMKMFAIVVAVAVLMMTTNSFSITVRNLSTVMFTVALVMLLRGPRTRA